MIFDDLNPIEHLSNDAAWEFLMSETVGRLAVSVGTQPDIFPVNYVGHDSKVYFRTAEGTKLLELTINTHVAFEADGYDETSAWSVVVIGSALAIESQSMIDILNTLPLHPFAPTLKYVWVEITPTELRGRSFKRGPEPERY
ncbi:MAG: pyridoxamine 5'-phosphate oxidase family protein [Actinomycetales bacterium]|nr:pyridoxamine 5'-phosphate oxidase family protein [Actinomycetales bacterium]